MEVILLHQRKSKRLLEFTPKNPGCSRGLVKQLQSLLFVCYSDGYWGMARTAWPWQQWQASSKSKWQCALLLPSSGMHEKSSLTSSNNITLWRHYSFFSHVYYPSIACRHSPNLMTLNQFTFEENSDFMRCCRPIEGKRDTLQRGKWVLLTSACLQHTELQILNH